MNNSKRITYSKFKPFKPTIVVFIILTFIFLISIVVTIILLLNNYGTYSGIPIGYISSYALYIFVNFIPECILYSKKKRIYKVFHMQLSKMLSCFDSIFLSAASLCGEDDYWKEISKSEYKNKYSVESIERIFSGVDFSKQVNYLTFQGSFVQYCGLLMSNMKNIYLSISNNITIQDFPEIDIELFNFFNGNISTALSIVNNSFSPIKIDYKGLFNLNIKYSKETFSLNPIIKLSYYRDELKKIAK